MFRELMAGRGSRANASTSGNFALWGNFLPPAGMGYARHLPLLAFLACLYRGFASLVSRLSQGSPPWITPTTFYTAFLFKQGGSPCKPGHGGRLRRKHE